MIKRNDKQPPPGWRWLRFPDGSMSDVFVQRIEGGEASDLPNAWSRYDREHGYAPSWNRDESVPPPGWFVESPGDGVVLTVVTRAQTKATLAGAWKIYDEEHGYARVATKPGLQASSAAASSHLSDCAFLREGYCDRGCGEAEGVMAQAHALIDAWDDWAGEYDGFDCDKFRLICTCFDELRRRMDMRRPEHDAGGDHGGCANCGCPYNLARKHLTGGYSTDDGEWTCSTECDEMLDDLGCPFDGPEGLREQIRRAALLRTDHERAFAELERMTVLRDHAVTRCTEVERERDAWKNGAHYWLGEYNRIASKHGEYVAPKGTPATDPFAKPSRSTSRWLIYAERRTKDGNLERGIFSRGDDANAWIASDDGAGGSSYSIKLDRHAEGEAEQARAPDVVLPAAPEDDGPAKNAAEQALDDIAKLCGFADWEYPGQVVRDVCSKIEQLGGPSITAQLDSLRKS